MDILVVNGEMSGVREKLKISAGGQGETIRIATSSIRRKAQWLHRYPNHQIENLRGNVNTRLAKLASSDWQGAIFAAAGLERIHLRPPQSIELDWMLPAPAQGAIIVVCREHDESVREICKLIHDDATGLCTRIERGFLKTLMGGCSTPVSALAELEEDEIYFRGSIISLDGKQKVEVERVLPADQAWDMGKEAAVELLNKGGDKIAEQFRRGSNYDTK
jgi:hydroxymethylbilane synthase